MCNQVSSQQKIKKNYISKFFSFIAGVIDTGDKHSFAITPRIFEKIRKPAAALIKGKICQFYSTFSKSIS